MGCDTRGGGDAATGLITVGLLFGVPGLAIAAVWEPWALVLLVVSGGAAALWWWWDWRRPERVDERRVQAWQRLALSGYIPPGRPDPVLQAELADEDGMPGSAAFWRAQPPRPDDEDGDEGAFRDKHGVSRAELRRWGV